MKLIMGKDDFIAIVTDRLNLAPSLLAGKKISEIKFPSRYSMADEVEIIFDEVAMAASDADPGMLS